MNKDKMKITLKIGNIEIRQVKNGGYEIKLTSEGEHTSSSKYSTFRSKHE